jgi:NAD-dependent oxidoreductase involved in siderophore biosynthesis
MSTSADGASLAEKLMSRDTAVREYQISIENLAILRERLVDCARREHVNQFIKCKEIRNKYIAAARDCGLIVPNDVGNN